MPKGLEKHVDLTQQVIWLKPSRRGRSANYLWLLWSTLEKPVSKSVVWKAAIESSWNVKGTKENLLIPKSRQGMP